MITCDNLTTETHAALRKQDYRFHPHTVGLLAGELTQLLNHSMFKILCRAHELGESFDRLEALAMRMSADSKIGKNYPDAALPPTLERTGFLPFTDTALADLHAQLNTRIVGAAARQSLVEWQAQAESCRSLFYHAGRDLLKQAFQADPTRRNAVIAAFDTMPGQPLLDFPHEPFEAPTPPKARIEKDAGLPDIAAIATTAMNANVTFDRDQILSAAKDLHKLIAGLPMYNLCRKLGLEDDHQHIHDMAKMGITAIEADKGPGVIANEDIVRFLFTAQNQIADFYQLLRHKIEHLPEQPERAKNMQRSFIERMLLPPADKQHETAAFNKLWPRLRDVHACFGDLTDKLLQDAGLDSPDPAHVERPQFGPLPVSSKQALRH